MENYELILIEKVEHLQSQQQKYWEEKRKYGNSTQQLTLCKKLEKELNTYCKNRKSEILNPQSKLFT